MDRRDAGRFEALVKCVRRGNPQTSGSKELLSELHGEMQVLVLSKSFSVNGLEVMNLEIESVLNAVIVYDDNLN